MRLPGRRFVALEGSNHILLGDEPTWPVFLAEVEAFLDAVAPSRGTRPAVRR